MKNTTIPFNKPTFVGNELTYIAEALERGHISGDGKFTRKCNTLLEEIIQDSKSSNYNILYTCFGNGSVSPKYQRRGRSYHTFVHIRDNCQCLCNQGC
jgi:hypothetical protein